MEHVIVIQDGLGQDVKPAAQQGLGVTVVLKHACVKTKGSATLWMGHVTVHQDG